MGTLSSAVAFFQVKVGHLNICPKIKANTVLSMQAHLLKMSNCSAIMPDNAILKFSNCGH